MHVPSTRVSGDTECGKMLMQGETANKLSASQTLSHILYVQRGEEPPEGRVGTRMARVAPDPTSLSAGQVLVRVPQLDVNRLLFAD